MLYHLKGTCGTHNHQVKRTMSFCGGNNCGSYSWRFFFPNFPICIIYFRYTGTPKNTTNTVQRTLNFIFQSKVWLCETALTWTICSVAHSFSLFLFRWPNPNLSKPNKRTLHASLTLGFPLYRTSRSGLAVSSRGRFRNQTVSQLNDFWFLIASLMHLIYSFPTHDAVIKHIFVSFLWGLQEELNEECSDRRMIGWWRGG